MTLLPGCEDEVTVRRLVNRKGAGKFMMGWVMDEVKMECRTIVVAKDSPSGLNNPPGQTIYTENQIPQFLQSGEPYILPITHLRHEESLVYYPFV